MISRECYARSLLIHGAPIARVVTEVINKTAQFWIVSKLGNHPAQSAATHHDAVGAGQQEGARNYGLPNAATAAPILILSE